MKIVKNLYGHTAILPMWLRTTTIIATPIAAAYIVWLVLMVLVSVNSFFTQYIGVEALIGMAALLIAVLIPVSILLIETTRESGIKWDTSVIVKRVLIAPRVLLAFFLLSAPLIFWKEESSIKPLLFIVFCVGVCMITKALIKGYRWLTVIESGHKETYRTKMRLEFLKALKAEERAAVWGLTWTSNSGERASIDERILTETFFDRIKDEGSTSQSASEMIQSYFDYFDSIHLDDPVIYEKVINFSIHYGERLISRHQSRSQEDGSIIVSEYTFMFTVRRLFFKIMEKSIKDEFMNFLFFDQIKKKMNDLNQEERVSLLESISANYFPESPEEDNRTTWEEFPDNWKVTFSNLTSEDNKTYSFIWLNAYLRWISSRKLLVNPDEFKMDYAANRVTERLFPDIDPTLWSDMISLHYSAFGSSSGESTAAAQVRNFVTSSKTFGLMSRVGEFTLVSDNDKDAPMRSLRKGIGRQKKEVLNINRSVNVFPQLRDKRKLVELIDAATQLSFDDKRHNSKRESLIVMLQLILSSLDDPG